MRVAVITLLTTSLFSAAAMAAPGVPSSVLNPPAYAPNKTQPTEDRMPGTTDADKDARTLQGVAASQPIDPASQRLNDARIHFIEMNKQLGDDMRNRASKEVIDKDRAAVEAARQQLNAARPPAPIPQNR